MQAMNRLPLVITTAVTRREVQDVLSTVFSFIESIVDSVKFWRMFMAELIEFY